MAESRLHELSARGQSVWIDYLSRDLVEAGELKRLMDEDAVVGVTSNPTIFQKAISQGNAYDEQLKELLEDEQDAKEIFLHLAVRDVESALALLAPVHEANAQDGYVSIEVDPNLAYDTQATYEEAIRLHEWIDRPNLYVKIPGTEPGLKAIEDCIAAGRSINVTLLFSLQRHQESMGAYVRGLERFVEGGGDPAKVRSVASFFVSRVDTEADKRLEAIGSEETIKAFQDHGEVRGDTVLEGVDEAHRLLEQLASVGVGYDDVVLTLEKEGVQKFSDSFAELLDGVRAKREAVAA